MTAWQLPGKLAREVMTAALHADTLGFWLCSIAKHTNMSTRVWAVYALSCVCFGLCLQVKLYWWTGGVFSVSSVCARS